MANTAVKFSAFALDDGGELILYSAAARAIYNMRKLITHFANKI